MNENQHPHMQNFGAVAPTASRGAVAAPKAIMRASASKPHHKWWLLALGLALAVLAGLGLVSRANAMIPTGQPASPASPKAPYSPNAPNSCAVPGFTFPTPYMVGTNPFSVAVGDFNRDGIQDLAATNSNSDNVSVLLGNSSGGFGAAANFAAGAAPYGVAVSDFNGDGIQDLVTANNVSNDATVLLGTGTGSFGSATSFVVGFASPIFVAAEDLNRDGKPDLAVGGFSNTRILLNSCTFPCASPNFSGAGTLGSGAVSIAAADLDRDGILDLASVNNDSFVYVRLGNGSGGFGSLSSFAVGTTAQSVSVADLNRDGNADLSVANYGSDNVSVLLGN